MTGCSSMVALWQGEVLCTVERGDYRKIGLQHVGSEQSGYPMLRIDHLVQ